MNMLFSNVEDYEPTSIESDVFISEIPVPLMKEVIVSQFKDPLENDNMDYVSIFLDNYNTSLYDCNEDNLEALDSIRDDFLTFMRSLLMETFEIGFPDFDRHEKTIQNDLILYTYRFFIRNIKKNFVGFFTNYIEKHKSDIAETCEDRNDVTINSFRKGIDDEDVVLILSNLSKVISGIVDTDIDVEEFISLSRQDLIETRLIDSFYDKFMITGNFVEPYKRYLKHIFLRNIEVKVRNKLINKYQVESKLIDIL